MFQADVAGIRDLELDGVVPGCRVVLHNRQLPPRSLYVLACKRARAPNESTAHQHPQVCHAYAHPPPFPLSASLCSASVGYSGPPIKRIQRCERLIAFLVMMQRTIVSF